MTTENTPVASGRVAGVVRTVGRWALGGALVFAGVGHLTAQRTEFQAQVPEWFPIDADVVVVVSGVIEIVLGLALVAGRRRVAVGWVVAAFFVAIFPGNIAQWVEGTDAFGLDSDGARFARLFFQPVLVVWALWSTGAWRAWRRSQRGS
ncbi:MAG: DoxX family membrane protein [Acidimicrobiales bacterium]